MPLIDVSKSVEPQTGIKNILKEVGFLKREKGEKIDISSELENSGLGLRDVLGRVREIAENGDTDSVRLAANKMSLEMHNVLKQEGGKNIPSVNITIVDANSVAVNPILIPR